MNLEVDESDWKFLSLFLFGVFEGIEQKARGFFTQVAATGSL